MRPKTRWERGSVWVYSALSYIMIHVSALEMLLRRRWGEKGVKIHFLDGFVTCLVWFGLELGCLHWDLIWAYACFYIAYCDFIK